jgi:hypothetical protein
MPFNVYEELDAASRDMFRRAEVVVAQCGDQAYVIKSRLGDVVSTPTLPNALIAYEEWEAVDTVVPHAYVLRLRVRNNTFGYPSDEPCWVCGKHDNNQSEPRFLYTVCEEHQNVPPVDIRRPENLSTTPA